MAAAVVAAAVVAATVVAATVAAAVVNETAGDHADLWWPALYLTLA